MSTATMTKEQIETAIRKGKATSFGGVWRALGHESKIGGSTTKRIKELVPNYEMLFKENMGTPATKEPVAPVAETPKMPKAKKVKVVDPNKPLFRPSSKVYFPVYTEAIKDYFDKGEFITRVAKQLDRSEDSVKFALNVLIYPTHRTNKGRTTVDVRESDGFIKIVPCKK